MSDTVHRGLAELDVVIDHLRDRLSDVDREADLLQQRREALEGVLRFVLARRDPLLAAAMRGEEEE